MGLILGIVAIRQFNRLDLRPCHAGGRGLAVQTFPPRVASPAPGCGVELHERLCHPGAIIGHPS